MTDPIDEAATNALCHYGHPSEINSCCSKPMGEKRCQIQAPKVRLAILKAMRERGPFSTDAFGLAIRDDYVDDLRAEIESCERQIAQQGAR